MSDLISRQDAIDLVNSKRVEPENRHLNDYEQGWNDACDNCANDWLEEMPPVSRWIPVSERLPEDSYETDLIVTTGSGMVKLAYFTKEDGFVSLTGFHRISEVTAWMELPKPYERKEDGAEERLSSEDCEQIFELAMERLKAEKILEQLGQEVENLLSYIAKVIANACDEYAKNADERTN